MFQLQLPAFLPPNAFFQGLKYIFGAGSKFVGCFFHSDDYKCLDASVSEYTFILLYEGIRCLQGMCSQRSEMRLLA